MRWAWRAHVHAMRQRGADWRDGRTNRTPAPDDELLAEIRVQIADLPGYGYRRACDRNRGWGLKPIDPLHAVAFEVRGRALVFAQDGFNDIKRWHSWSRRSQRK